MSTRAERIAWLACLLALLVVAASIGLAIVNRGSIDSLSEANAIEIVLPIGYAILGSLVAARQPRNAMGWLFLAIAFFNGLPGTTTQYTRFALVTEPGAPFTPWIPWIGYFASTLVYPCGMAVLALLLIPNGRFLSPRWRYVAWLGAAITVALETLMVLDPMALQLDGLPLVPSPTGIAAFAGTNSGTLGSIGFLIGLAVIAAAAASVVLRLRRSHGEERLQLRWVAYSVALAVGVNVAFTAIAIVLLPQQQVAVLSVLVVILGFGVAMPVGFAVAMLRYRLYDLDLLLNRTVLYSAVSIVLLVLFGLANLLAQRAVVAVVGERSDLVSASLGLAAGLAFAPMRRRLRPLVDHALPARARLALLFTDIVESTQAVVDLGDEQWRGLLDRYRSTVRQTLARHRGREVNTAGDGFFAVFDRPANAVRCAIAMRDAVGQLGLRVRTGLHLGDVEMRGEQVSGLAVHAAARVMSEATAGEILVSAELAAVLPEMSLRDAGRHALRGVPGEWQLFEVAGPASC